MLKNHFFKFVLFILSKVKLFGLIARSINFYITILVFPCEPRSNLFQEGQWEMNKYRSIIKISGTIARCNYVFIQILTFQFGTILDCVLSLMVFLNVPSMKWIYTMSLQLDSHLPQKIGFDWKPFKNDDKCF